MEGAVVMDSSMLTLKEILDMRNTISDIDIFLAQIGLTEEKMREYIYYLNEKYPDNIAAYNLLYPRNAEHILVENARTQALISDLRWKQYYLRAKIDAKSIDEMRKELWKNNK